MITRIFIAIKKYAILQVHRDGGDVPLRHQVLVVAEDL